MKNKPLTGAERTRRNKLKYQEAGLMHAKVWIHPEEAQKLRNMASEMPLTKAARIRLK